MAKPQWISSSDPFWSQYGDVNARDPESGEFTNPYISTIRGLQDVGNWQNVARQLGYQGPFETQVYATHEGGYDVVPAPEFLQFIEQKKAEGYDFVVKGDEVDKSTSTFGLRTPSGEVVGQRKAKAAGFGEFFKEFLLPAAGIAFGMGGLNSLMGGAAAPANALTGAGLGAMEGVGLTGNIVNAATGQTIASLPTAAMTAADIGRGLGDVLGQVSQAPAVEVGAPLGAEGAGAMYADVPMAAGTETGLFGEQFHPIRNYPYSDITLNTLAEPAASVMTPAAATTDAAAAMQLRPMTQLQPITQAPNALAGIEALAGVPIDPAFAAGMGVDAGMAALTPEVLAQISANVAPIAAAPILASAGTVPAGSIMEGMIPGGLTSAGISPTAAELMATGAVAAGAGAAAPTILDQAIDLLKSPAGQAVVGGVGSVVGGVMQAEAAKDVAAQQATAAENALKLQREMFEYQQSLLAPYRKAGEAALGRLSGAMGLGGPAQQQQMLEMDPGYGFRLGEGMKALERMQAARGNMLSGGALKAGTEYAQKFASGEYQNAFNRLADIAGIGRSTAAQQGTAAQQFGQTAGQTGMDVANALAAGRYGRTSAYTGALEGALGAYENYLNRQQRNQVYRDIYGRMLGGGS